MRNVPQWNVFELTLESTRDYDNPFWDVAVQVHVTAPSGSRRAVDGFWDGGRTWRARFSPSAVGEWSWTSECADDTGLHAQRGAFQCTPYTGSNPLYQHGPLQLSEDRRYLVHADSSPFFWLADTAWNGVLRSREEDWIHYLQTRRQQGFTAVQFVSTQWRGLSRDPHGETAFSGTEHIRLNPGFFQRLDPKVAAINEHGLVAAPVLLWAFTESDPGQTLSEADAIRLVRYLVARWGAYQATWILGGDGNYHREQAERWKRIGRAALAQHDRLATMHPWGQAWVGDEFRDEPWLSFIGYQSGHGDSDEHLRWLVEGPPATEWNREPALPVVNLEPNYETHPAYHSKKPFTAAEVRRAAYWSLLVSPTAGVTFGHNGIWNWSEQPEAPENHEIGTVVPWHEALDTPGVRSTTVLRQFFDLLPWWRLRPAPELLLEQPGKSNPRLFVAVAKTDEMLVAYLPGGGNIRLKTERLNLPVAARWFNPRTGGWTEAGAVAEAAQAFAAPDSDDWILLLEGSS